MVDKKFTKMKRKEFIKLSSTAALGIASLGYQSFSKPKDLFFKLIRDFFPVK